MVDTQDRNPGAPTFFFFLKHFFSFIFLSYSFVIISYYNYIILYLIRFHYVILILFLASFYCAVRYRRGSAGDQAGHRPAPRQCVRQPPTGTHSLLKGLFVICTIIIIVIIIIIIVIIPTIYISLCCDKGGRRGMEGRGRRGRWEKRGEAGKHSF